MQKSLIPSFKRYNRLYLQTPREVRKISLTLLATVISGTEKWAERFFSHFQCCKFPYCLSLKIMSMYYSGNGENAIFRKSIFESGECQPNRPQQVTGDFSTRIPSCQPRPQSPGFRAWVTPSTCCLPLRDPGHPSCWDVPDTVRLGRWLSGRVLTVQTQGPECEPWCLSKRQMCQCMLVFPAMGRKRRGP